MTSDIQLRNVEEKDLAVFFAQQLDPEANRVAAFPARDRAAFMKHWAKILNDESVTKRTILYDGKIAGNIVSFPQSGKTLVGYWIGRNYWGKGIATRALSSFLTLVSARPLYAHVAKHNIASIKVLEKCGFKVCGEDKMVPFPDGGKIEELILRLDAPEEK